MGLKAGAAVTDRFEVLEHAGTGGMGAVYRARDRTTGGLCALKVLRVDGESERRRFLREARALAELRHPGIVRYVDHGTDQSGQLYLAMEWVEGESLGQRLARQGVTAAETVRVVRLAAEALAAAHRRGIVHRDLKPSNIMLEGERVVKLVDFGLARFEQRADVSATGMMLGTLNYMAPEQAQGSRHLDARADVFALGCLVFKCLTGQTPFAGHDLRAVLTKLLFEPAPRLRSRRAEVPPELDALVARMLDKDPAARPAHAGEVAALLAGIDVADGRAPVPSARLTAITGTEQRLVGLLLAGDVRLPEASDPTMAQRKSADFTLASMVLATVAAHGGHVEHHDGEAVLASFRGRGSATDLAVQNARCGLALRALWPEVPIAAVTGWVPTELRVADAPLFARAGAVQREAQPLRTSVAGTRRVRPIALDLMTSDLLDARFDVAVDGVSRLLLSERDLAAPTRTLLGRPSPCIGRDRELGALVAIYAGCVEEQQARAVLVTGPAGGGKSRLRYELVNALRERDDGAEIWIARGDAMRSRAPFGLIAPLVRRIAGIKDGEPIDTRRQKLRARVGRHVAEADRARVVEFVGELAAVPTDDVPSRELALARDNAVMMGDQERRAFEDWLAAETAAHPVVLILEDLHWGDLPSVKLVDAALRNLADRPLFVLALARPEVHDAFPALWRDREVHEMPLRPLARKAAEALARGALEGRATDPEVARVVDLAGGNVFYLEELVRAVAAGQTRELPGTVVAMVQSRLAEMDAELRRVLRAASAFGQTFWRGGVVALLGGEGRAPAIDDALDDLIEHELVSERATSRFPGERELAFRHALVRDGVYAMLSESDRTLAHSLAAAWLERAGEDAPRVLAEHHERGGQPAQAARWYEALAVQSLEGNDFVSTLAAVDRALACGASGERRGSLKLIAAEAQRWRADQAAAEALALEALQGLPPRTPRWFDALGEVAQAACRLGHAGVLERAHAELARAAAAGETSGRFVIAACTLTVQLTTTGRVEEAGRILGHVEAAFARGDGDPLVSAWVNRVRAFVGLYAGDALAYLRSSEAAARDFERAGAVRNASAISSSVGFALLSLGRYEEAEARLRASLATAVRMGLPTQAALAKSNLGVVLARTGRVAEGLRLQTEALAEAVAQHDRRIESGVRAYLAMLHLEAGSPAAALREAEASLEVSSEPARPLALALMAAAHLAAGDLEASLGRSGEASALLDRVGAIEEGGVLVHLTRARVLHAGGRVDEAKASLARAHAELERRAAKVADEPYRTGFLTLVPENAETLRLVREWGLC